MEGLGSSTFGSGSVRHAPDGRCHFTITTGNTRPGPDAAPMSHDVRPPSSALGLYPNIKGILLHLAR